MSSGGGRAPSRAIPAPARDAAAAAALPPGCCSTPGGTLFSTTPGGTRIIYDRKFLLERRNSPMAQTPPGHLPDIPGVTSPGSGAEEAKDELANHDGKPPMGDEAQFEMDM